MTKGNVQRMIAQLAKPGMTAVDIGAGGTDTVKAAAEAVGPTGRVYAFEPDTRRTGELATLVADYPWIVWDSRAVWRETGSVRFHRHTDPNKSSCHPVEDEFVNVVDLPCVRLDDARIGAVDLIKVDTQGSECDILAGATRYLTDGVPWILEWWPHGLKAAGRDPFELPAFLWAYGYTVTDLDGEVIDEMKAREYAAIGDRPDRGNEHVNVMATRSES